MRFIISSFVALVLLNGCDSSIFTASSKKETQSETLVVQTSEIFPFEHGDKLEGLVTVLSPDPLLQIDTDMKAASIAAAYSQDKLQRFKNSDGLAQQELFDAERQSLNDQTQLQLLESRLRQTWGDQAPFLNSEERKSLIGDLSSGSKSILRLDVPELLADKLKNIKVVPLHGNYERTVDVFWVSPAGNQFMTGVSYFGIIDSAPGLRPGDRGRFSAERSTTKTGLVIPESAIVVFAGQSWCYIETIKGNYERRVVSLSTPINGGYLVPADSDFTQGMRVVVRGASLLLSREASSKDQDDNSDDQEKTQENDNKISHQPQDEKRSSLDLDTKTHSLFFSSDVHFSLMSNLSKDEFLKKNLYPRKVTSCIQRDLGNISDTKIFSEERAFTSWNKLGLIPADYPALI